LSKQDPTSDSILYVPVKGVETIEDIVKRLGIPHEELGRNIFLNGRLSALSREVKDGDRLGIFPWVCLYCIGNTFQCMNKQVL
jgi:hypothetical protein